MATIAGKIFRGIGKFATASTNSGFLNTLSKGIGAVGKTLLGSVGNILSGPLGIGALISGITGGKKGLQSYGENVQNKMTGEHLTGAEREANAFSAQQAQVARDYETQMSNSQYQRGVADMQQAGVNPALMYGQGAAPAGTPSSPSPTSTSPEGSDPVGMIAQIAQLKLLDKELRLKESDIGLKRAQTEKTETETQEVMHRIGQIDTQVEATLQSMEKMKAEIENVKIDTDTKRKAFEWIDREKEASLKLLNEELKVKAQNIRESEQRVENLKSEQQKTLQEIINKREEVLLMASQIANLDQDSQLKGELTGKVAHEVEQIDALTGKLQKETNLTQKDIDYYVWNHGKITSFGGLTVHANEIMLPKEKHQSDNYTERQRVWK